MSSTTGLGDDAGVERLPASSAFLAARLAIGALLIPILWLWLGALAGEATGAALAAVALLFVPRALVLDEQGFRQVSLIPRRKVLWRAVDSFTTGSAPRTGMFVLYTRPAEGRAGGTRRVGPHRAASSLHLRPGGEAEP